MADLPFSLTDAGLQSRLAPIVDPEGKIGAALAALGPLEDRDVLLLGCDADGTASLRARQLEELGARVRAVPERVPPEGIEPVDVVVGTWTLPTGQPDAWPAVLSAAQATTGPGGRLLLVEDYGRDAVTALLGEEARAAQLVAMSRRDGWMLTHEFKVRVLHCWWTFPSLEEAAELLPAAFGEAGHTVAGRLQRPRLSYKVAVYHRDLRPPAS